MRTYRIILSKLGLAPDKQPSPPMGDNPDDVQKIVDAVLGIVGHLEHALYRVEEGTTRRAPVSAEYIGQLRAQLAQQTLLWLSDWPTDTVIEEPEEWGT